jgi:tetratricopeptide (TPR) repeat protein
LHGQREPHRNMSSMSTTQSTTRVTGRQVFPFVFAALIAALGAQTLRVRDRIEASRLLAQVEAQTIAAVQARHAPSTMFVQHLQWLDRAQQLDPLEIGIPIARGAQYLLLRQADPAIAAYREAAALEPRPEIDLNLGRALLMRGDKDGARLAFARAIALNPTLRNEVPPGGLDPAR